MNQLEYTGAGDATTKGILTLKIILVGARHTGKGQIGRAWGATTADLPTLQPAILYERLVQILGHRTRVVTWVLSFDPEFQYLLDCMYKKTHGIVYTCNASPGMAWTLDALDGYKKEVESNFPDNTPPSTLIAVEFSSGSSKGEKLNDEKLSEWSRKNGDMPWCRTSLEDLNSFTDTITEAIMDLALLCEEQ